MADGKKEYTLTWLIDNYSYCWHDNGEKLVSPTFTTDGVESTSWNLQLYPRGKQEGRKHEITLFLVRSDDDSGPETLTLKYELSVIADDGIPYKSFQKEDPFQKGDGHGVYNFLYVDEVLLRKKPVLLKLDFLKLQCKIWYGEGRVRKAGEYTARTRIGIEKIYFVQKVVNFSALKPNEKEIVHVASQSKPECVISCSLYFNDNSCCEDKMMVEIASNDSSYRLIKHRVFLLKEPGSQTCCGEIHNILETPRNDVRELTLSLTRQNILDRSFEFLPNDELCLRCECTFSTGIEFQKVEDTRYKLPMLSSKKGCKVVVSKKEVYNTEAKLSLCSTVSEDLKAILFNNCHTDVLLKTKTKTFPTNKIMLSARSTVFKAMLNEDVKEKITDCIQVDDLENETVEQLLFFLYSDTLEKLEWGSLIKLYCASNKYAIEKLKMLSSCILVDNLSTSNACELLLLADSHNDFNLKHFVEDFILKHKEQIIESEEWQNLEITNPQFVQRTINLMIKGKKE